MTAPTVQLTPTLTPRLGNALQLAAVVPLVLMAGLWWVLFDAFQQQAFAQFDELGTNLLALAIVLVGHELLHFLAYPRDGLGRFGFSRTAYAPYATYEGALTKGRFLLAAHALRGELNI